MKAYVTASEAGLSNRLLNDLGENSHYRKNLALQPVVRADVVGLMLLPRYASVANGFSAINLTKVDVLNELARLKSALPINAVAIV